MSSDGSMFEWLVLQTFRPFIMFAERFSNTIRVTAKPPLCHMSYRSYNFRLSIVMSTYFYLCICQASVQTNGGGALIDTTLMAPG